MQNLIDAVANVAIEILVLLLLFLGSAVALKAKEWYQVVKQKDTLGILDLITDRAVEYADQELKGAKGLEKRQFALDYTKKILLGMGIKMTDEQILADIQNGYNKWKQANNDAVEEPPLDIENLVK
ncbi:Phage holin protein [compost metagenome]